MSKPKLYTPEEVDKEIRKEERRIRRHIRNFFRFGKYKLVEKKKFEGKTTKEDLDDFWHF